jgi:hypothetical protein
MTRDPQFFDETVDAVNETALLDVDTRARTRFWVAASLCMVRVAGGGAGECHE